MCQITFLASTLNWLQQSISSPLRTLPEPPKTEETPSPKQILDSTKRAIYVVTSTFEGGPEGKINYTNLSGNFDKQGYSIGFLQWCVGQGSDLKLFQKMLAEYPDKMKIALGTKYDSVISAMKLSQSERLQWAKSINTPTNKIKPDWQTAFITLCQTSEFQTIQEFFAADVLTGAIIYCQEYALQSIRGLMLMFDIKTQNGSINNKTKENILVAKKNREQSLERKLTEKEYLEIIAQKRAAASNPAWVADVLTRKMCIVKGTGTVHGSYYDLTKFGITDAAYLN